MNPLTSHLVTATVMLYARVTGWLDAQATREQEEGSQTTDIILWVVAIVAIVGIAAAGVTAFVNTQLGKLG